MADHVIATLTSKYTAPLMNHWIPLGEESLGGKIFSNNSSSKVYTIHNLIIKLSTEILVLQWVLDYRDDGIQKCQKIVVLWISGSL